MDNTGMVKLIYSSTFDTTVDVGMRLVEDPSLLTKSASTIFECTVDDLVPDKDHLGIHLVALGDFEHYGANRNGDGFPKKSCVVYHHTFVKNGNLYRHHRNKDPEKRLGQIVKSAYNEPMGRIELFVHAHKERAADELQRLATDGDIPFSMACKVAFDRCSKCGTLRRSSKDPEQCDHVRFSLGKVADDGTVICTHNDEPNYFDISVVTRPADRIAWHLKAASGEVIDSVKLAEAEGIWVPDGLAIVSGDAVAKLSYLDKMAAMEELYSQLRERRPANSRERYFWELRKAAVAKPDDETIQQLRSHEPKDVFHKLAQAGTILDIDSFYKYAMGPDYGEFAPFMDEVRRTIGGVYGRLKKEGTCQGVCNDRLFDVDARILSRGTTDLQVKVAEFTFIGPEMEQRIIELTINNNEIELDKNEKISSNGTVERLVEKYAAYKLSAVKAILAMHKNTDTDALFAVAAAQNLVN